ncbi:MAG TPA: tRNA (adenosine(37)-N6)-threonylcarbamoyltransferase complex transferase subunit TsaD [Bacilli bacterium]|nr:tRNA (adenosine(37)-N6)-threonylcarbamoyltransferase complex transferase subunit TsaD [Bacilli bacterium]
MEKKIEFNVLAIETSCDETSVSIVRNGKEDVGTIILSQIDIHKSYGGVVPEIASRTHTKNITIVLEELLEKTNMNMNDIDAFAVTSGPGLNGSLLVGVEAAKALAYIYKKPLIPVNHLSGHIYANSIEHELVFPLLVLLVSGGHTELIYMDKHYSFKKLGGTLDDSVGEAYDKVARVIGIPYPGGPEIDKLANIGKHTYDLPIPKDDTTNDFSFSGIKSAVINLVHNEKQKGKEINREDLCTSFQEVVIDILIKKTIRLAKELNINNILLSGGVSANSLLRKNMKDICDKENINLVYPSLKYCTDNATMIGAAAYYAYKENISANSSLNTNPNQKL